jgi:hypothetical protein
MIWVINFKIKIIVILIQIICLILILIFKLDLKKLYLLDYILTKVCIR